MYNKIDQKLNFCEPLYNEKYEAVLSPFKTNYTLIHDVHFLRQAIII